MNALLILGLLCLIVPTQLLLNYVLQNTEAGLSFQTTTVSSLREGAVFIYDQIQLTARYYSTYEHLKELVMVPYIPHQGKARDILRKRYFEDRANGMEVITINLSGSNEDESSESTSSQSKKTKEYQKAEQTLTNEEITYTHKEQSSVTSSSTLTYNEPPLDEEISPAREVEEYNEKNVYFTRSSAPRNHRPLNVMYGVGQVIKHIYDGYVGVIIGWDTKCKAPQWWLKKHSYGRQNLITSPHYLVLVDSDPDSDEGSDLYYLPQDHITLQPDVRVTSNDLENYFHHYSSSDHKYIPKEWLQKRYPQDK